MIESGLAINFILGSLFYAAQIFLISAGLNVIFGVLRIVNLAHGSLYLLGAYIAYTLFTIFGEADKVLLTFSVPLLTALIVGCIGMAIEIFMRVIYKLPVDYQLLFTFGLILILADIMRMTWGTIPLSFGSVYVVYGNINIGNSLFPIYNLYLIAASFITGLLLWYFLQKTRIGTLIRAVASDREISSGLGIDIRRVFLVTFFIGSLLGGLGGGLTVPVVPASPGADISILILAFVAVVVGGLGSIKGALVGALLLSFFRFLAILWYPELELFTLYLFMTAVLIVRPYGLFGVRE